MKAEKQNQGVQSRTLQSKQDENKKAFMVDNRNTAQMKTDTLQSKEIEEGETIQGKFVTQLQDEEEKTDNF